MNDAREDTAGGTVQKQNKGWYDRFVNSIQGAYFGVVAMTLAVSGIFGGVALSYIFRGEGAVWQLILSIALVLGNMILPVAQQKLKPVITLFIISIAVNS